LGFVNDPNELTMSVRIYAMTCGWLTMPMPMLLHGTQGKLKIPIPAYLIRHAKGTAVFDSGMSLRVQQEGAQALGPLAPYFDVHYAANEDIKARLAGADVAAEKIDFLISSHLHFDHCGGNELVPNARWIVQKREWAAASTPEAAAANHYDPADYDLGHDRIEADGEYDVFGDGSVRCIPTHGHTPGHQSLVVETATGPIVLCGDACYLKQTIDDMHLPAPSAVHDEVAMRASLERLRQLREAGARLMFGHDPDFWTDVPQAPLALA
jgi:glyoxylase-like metal-dependent hydrolase (beta-lactamase superfamily II)